jgi:hypothetical protein
MADSAPTKRDRHLQLIAERGRMGWQRASGYNGLVTGIEIEGQWPG